MSVSGSWVTFPTMQMHFSRLWEQHGSRNASSRPTPSENTEGTDVSFLSLDGLTMVSFEVYPEGSDATTLAEGRPDPIPRRASPVTCFCVLCPTPSGRKSHQTHPSKKGSPRGPQQRALLTVTKLNLKIRKSTYKRELFPQELNSKVLMGSQISIIQ